MQVEVKSSPVKRLVAISAIGALAIAVVAAGPRPVLVQDEVGTRLIFVPRGWAVYAGRTDPGKNPYHVCIRESSFEERLRSYPKAKREKYWGIELDSLEKYEDIGATEVS